MAEKMSTQDAQAPEQTGEPGSVSSPEDVGGRGPVGLQDRTAHGGQASPDTNQAKAEPIPPTPGDSDPAAALDAPTLGEMNIGAGNPQLASHPAARDRDVPLSGGTLFAAGSTAPAGPVNPGINPADDLVRKAGRTTGTSAGPAAPPSTLPGRAQRAPGSMGESPEEQETDTAAGAARMSAAGAAGTEPSIQAPGDPHGVLVPSLEAADGTSEQQQIVHGARTPVANDDEGSMPA